MVVPMKTGFKEADLSFDVFVLQAEASAHIRPSYLRHGQFLFNYLYDHYPMIADKVRGTLEDPFHRDDRIPMFWETVQEYWSLTSGA